MKKTLLIALFTGVLANASQATLVFNEEFDGAGANYNINSTTAIAGDNDWVDFSNRIGTSFSGTEGYTTALGGSESVLTGGASVGDPQVRSDFSPVFDKTLVTNVTLRLRVDADLNNTYDDTLTAANFDVFWGTDPYVNPGAQNGNTQLNYRLSTTVAPILTAEADGWYTVSWSFAEGSLTSGSSGDTVNSLRIDPVNQIAGASFEVDYLRVYAVPEPGTAMLLGMGSALMFFARRRLRVS